MPAVYNVNSNATQVLASKQIKENIFVDLVHKNGKGVTEQTETNATSVRIFKQVAFDDSARKLGATTNGGFFNSDNPKTAQIIEYDLDLLYVYDTMVDLPELQQDVVAVDAFDQSMKGIGGRVSTEINASTIAHQLACKINAVGEMTTPAWTNHAVVVQSNKIYDAILSANSMLDDGDENEGIQIYPEDNREILLTSQARRNLLSQNGVLLGGSNFAQSMIAKGGLDPNTTKGSEKLYAGEIDNVPCYKVPKTIWNRTKAWLVSDDTTKLSTANLGAIVDDVQALVICGLGTDRGISTPEYVKIIDSPNGAGKRLQPKTRWGINVCYPTSIVPVLATGTTKPTTKGSVSVMAPGSISQS